MPHRPLQLLAAHGQSVWLDALSRDMLHSGALARLIRDDAVSGVTTNPSILEQALASVAYDDQITALAAGGCDARTILLLAASDDVRDACDLLLPTWERTGGKDGRVSLEVDPDFAHDAVATLEAARLLTALVDRPNLLVKIPATPAGVVAIEHATAEGISVNATLIFGLDRYLQVAASYLRGLERLLDDGGDPAAVTSVASVFVSRIDRFVDARLIALDVPTELHGTFAIANAQLIERQYRRLLAGERWARLSDRGANPQRLLWASTACNEPGWSDVRYVEALIGPGTVTTLPERTLRAFQDHGRVERTLGTDPRDAQFALQRVLQAGLDYGLVTSTLEVEGLRQFAAAQERLVEAIAGRMPMRRAA